MTIKGMFLSKIKLSQLNKKYYSKKNIFLDPKIKISQVIIDSSPKYIDAGATHIYLRSRSIYWDDKSLRPTIEDSRCLSNPNTVAIINKYLQFDGSEKTVEDVFRIVKIFYDNESAQGLIWTLTSIKNKDDENKNNPNHLFLFNRAYDYMIKLYIEGDSRNPTLISNVFLRYPLRDINNVFSALTLDKTNDRFDRVNKLIELSDKYNVSAAANSQKYNFIKLCYHSDLEMLRFIVKYFENRNEYMDIHYDDDEALVATLRNNNYEIMYWLINLSKTKLYAKFKENRLRCNKKLWQHPVDLGQISELFNNL